MAHSCAYYNTHYRCCELVRGIIDQKTWTLTTNKQASKPAAAVLITFKSCEHFRLKKKNELLSYFRVLISLLCFRLRVYN